jgi:type IV pilus assembly protein PilP
MTGAGWRIAVLAVTALCAGACQKHSVGPQAADYQKQRAAIIAQKKQELTGGAPAAMAQQQQQARQDLQGGLPASTGPSYVYDPTDKRDPFRSFVLERLKEIASEEKGPLEQFDLAQLNVLGVVWDTNQPRALVADPSGQGYIVREGDPIGKNDGEVVRISDNMILVRETYVDYVGEKTTKEIEMHVRQSQGG